MAVTRRTKIRGLATRVFSGPGAPVDGAVGTGTGAGKAVPGSVYIDTAAAGAGRHYRNEGTLASPVWSPIGRMVVRHSLGRNGAGNLALTGTKVGDRVTAVYNVTTPGNQAASFETVITVADAIQQSDAANLSAVNLLFFVQR
jgi:hypothetical protein